MSDPPAFPLHIHVALDLAGAFLTRGSGLRLALAPTCDEAERLRAWLDEPSRAQTLDTEMPAIDPPGAILASIPNDASLASLRARAVGSRIAAVMIGSPARQIAQMLHLPRVGPTGSVRGLGIGRASSVAWALCVRAARRANRPDLADRYEIRYRQSLAPTRSLAFARTILVLVEPT